MRSQNAIAFCLTTFHTSSQLVQLGKAETVCILNDHQCGVGYVHTDLNDRGCNHHIRFPPCKGGHGFFLLGRLHLTVEQRNPKIGKYGFLQGFCPNCGCFDAQIFIFFHSGTHHKALVTLCHLLTDKGIDTGAVALSHQEGIHRFPPWGQFINDRNIQIAVHQQRQCPRNWRCRHHQQVGIFSLGRQAASLGNAEAVLLVGNHQSQILERGGIRQQRMGADRQSDFAGCNPLAHNAFFFDCHGAGQKSDRDAHGFKQTTQGLMVLLCQNLRRCHQRRLTAIDGCKIRGCRRHHGLAAAHIALHQPVHRRAFSEISQNLIHSFFLGTSERKGQRIQKRLQIQLFKSFHRFSGTA